MNASSAQKQYNGGKERAKALLQTLRRFFNSELFYVFETLFACLLVVMRQEVIGAVIFVALISLLLIVCEDILPTTLPFLLLCTFTTNCYDSFDTFIGYAVYAPVVVAALIAHFVVYRGTLKMGESVYGICLVSIAVLLGGVGDFTLKQYVSGAYYIFGLGAGMIFAYMLMKSAFSARRGYDVRMKFAAVMTLVGVLCSFMIATGYVRRYLHLSTGAYTIGFSPNNLATLLMFAMPFPIYLSRKQLPIVILTPVFLAMLCLTKSRGGLIFGCMEFFICCLYWVCMGKKHKTERIIYCVAALGAVACAFGRVVLDMLQDRIFADGVIISNVRFTMFGQALDNFYKRPFVGTGILDESIWYSDTKKQGAMTWYHMMIPQVVGSMGLIGIVAYGFQILQRVKLTFQKRSTWSLALGISYLGLLMMSQVNPGEFCPLPFGLLAVLLFIFQEIRLEYDDLPLTGKQFHSGKSRCKRGGV